MERPRGPSCLYIMRATFLLPLARMLAAFYGAIKVVNQSLLNDLCFLTCFTGGEGAGTVAVALLTHGSALRGSGGGLCNRHNPWLSGLWYTLSMTRLLRDHRAGGCAQERSRGRSGKQKGFSQQHVVFQLPMYSCRVVFATAFNSHKFGSTGYI